jgi:dipeptidase E
MNLILTSDFPATPNPRVVHAVQAVSTNPRIAWIPAQTDAQGRQFADARQQFAGLGFTDLELVDIDEDRDEVQLAYLHEYDVIVLTGADAVRFRFNANRSGLSGRLRQCLVAGRLVVGVSGGALLLTPNVSALRLEHEPLDAVLATRGRFEALAAVPYEFVPHRDRRPPAFLEQLRAYSVQLDHDVVAAADGSAMMHLGDGPPLGDGSITRYRKGNIIEP